jgi:hypothetical protein
MTRERVLNRNYLKQTGSVPSKHSVTHDSTRNKGEILKGNKDGQRRGQVAYSQRLRPRQCCQRPPRFLYYRDQRWPVVTYATRLLRQVMPPENRRLIASAKGEGPTEATKRAVTNRHRVDRRLVPAMSQRKCATANRSASSKELKRACGQQGKQRPGSKPKKGTTGR